MIKEVLKALIGVGSLPEDPPKPTIFNFMFFGFLLILSFLGAVVGLLFFATLIINV